MQSTSSLKPVAQSIKVKLEDKFQPVKHLEIIDESHKHASHAAMKEHDSSSGETHFKVTIVSDAFEGMSLIQRHRAVNDCLK